MRRIGFTGTQRGLTQSQIEQLKTELSNRYELNAEFHHGDCIGADNEAHLIAAQIGYIIIVHPPLNSSKRAFVTGHFTWPMKDYLSRNRDIVDCSEILIACPNSPIEVLRSGTWATIRYALKRRVNVVIINS